MRDVCDVLYWARKILPTLTLPGRPDICADGDSVVAVGWSSGGHLAMTLGWMAASLGIRPPEAVLARAAAVIAPPCLIPPPIAFLVRRIRRIKLASPRTIAPIGAPRFLLKSTDTTSTSAQHSLSEPAPAATASKSRAPSRCVLTPCRFAQSRMRWSSCTGRMMPPAVFSIDTIPVGHLCTSSSSTVAMSFQTFDTKIFPIRKAHSLNHPATQDRRPAALEIDTMRIGIEQNPTRAGRNERVQTEFVGHGSHDDEYAFFAAGDGGDVGFEIERHAVFAEDVVAEGGFDYGGEHAEAGAGDYIALSSIIDVKKKSVERFGLVSSDWYRWTFS